MRLPDVIEVEVRTPDGQPIPGILVWLNTLALGQDYYRTLVGLTNRAGKVTTGRQQLLADHREDQRMFPMDYKLGLEEGDEEIVVGIEGGAVFAGHRQAALESALTFPRYKDMWQEAANEAYGSAQVRVAEDDLRTRRLRIELRVPHVSQTVTRPSA